MSLRGDRATGFQLTRDTVHAVCLVRRSGATRVAGTATVAIGHQIDPVRLGEDAARRSLVEALSAAAGRLPGKRGRVCMGLGRGTYLLKVTEVLFPDPTTRAQARENLRQLHWEMEQILDDQMPLFAVDVTVVGRWGVVAAARRSVLDRYAEAALEAGLGEPCFDIEPFALYNAAEAAGVLSVAPQALLVNRCGAEVDVVVVRGGGLAGVEGCHDGAETPEAVVECLRRCADADTARGGDGETGAWERIWVGGNGAEELCAAVAKELGIPGEPLPWGELAQGGGAEEGRPELAVAAGLAVRRLDT